MIMEMEKLPMCRASILSVKGGILCVDGTRKILKKIYGEGQDSMQYVTSVLNEWGQFLTTVVMAAESEVCYRRMAKAMMSGARRRVSAHLQAISCSSSSSLYNGADPEKTMYWFLPDYEA
ncbi:unnamed protein product [Knipowitschia caucasica]